MSQADSMTASGRSLRITAALTAALALLAGMISFQVQNAPRAAAAPVLTETFGGRHS